MCDFKPIKIQNTTFSPPLFLAPMAGITNSAFRRLLSEFGGYGALYTEMLSTTALVKEQLNISPFTRRRSEEGTVFYQLKSSGKEPIAVIVKLLQNFSVDCIDINLGCPAPLINRSGCGKALFDNFDLLKTTLEQYRNLWNGILSVKCRLGNETPGWEDRFTQRIELFEQCGIDSVCVHPRFSDDKLKRPAKSALYQWIRSLTPLPLIANGDIGRKECTALMQTGFVDGIMIGRAAVTKPWIFSQIADNCPTINHKVVWQRLFDYTCEDFPPEKAIGRIKEFSAWYAYNFYFGHEFARVIQSAPDLSALHERACAFLDSDPQLESE